MLHKGHLLRFATFFYHIKNRYHRHMKNSPFWKSSGWNSFWGFMQKVILLIQKYMWFFSHLCKGASNVLADIAESDQRAEIKEKYIAGTLIMSLADQIMSP